jgi:hypothetical protein
MDIFDNKTKPGTDKTLGKKAHGRILKDNYNFLGNNCTTLIRGVLPKRVQDRLEVDDFKIQTKAGLVMPQPNPFIHFSPPDLGKFLDGTSNIDPGLVTKLPTIRQGQRKY